LFRIKCAILLAILSVAVLAQACIVAADESPRGTAVRLATPTTARAIAPTSPPTVVVSPTLQAATTAPPNPTASSTSGPANPTASAAIQAGETYVVQPGDTLFALSRRTGVPVADIARASGIPADSQLRIGQQLRIPAAPAAAAAAPSASSIRVASPESGATVRSPIVVQGTAAVFEGVVNIEVLAADGTELARTSATASQPDAGQPGPFRAEVALPASGPERRVTLRVFWRSPRDGTPMDEVRIPLTVVG